VPETVPTKEEWVPNDEVVECMCCHQVAFSMFNRRHHCRRCGRVVCYNCSSKRMLVPTYGDILLRVCSDCYSQTSEDGGSSDKSDLPSTRSLIQEYWLLNDDSEHNKIIREEFSYEHAPSTSLCFSILKYHSKSVEYPK
jgi:zinc finger FYVE domain-containing protein 26